MDEISVNNTFWDQSISNKTLLLTIVIIERNRLEPSNYQALADFDRKKMLKFGALCFSADLTWLIPLHVSSIRLEICYFPDSFKAA